MKASKKEKLILSLIKDDLINCKLVNGLSDAAGLNADDYYLHLSTTIFRLMGYKEDLYSDKIFEQYRDLSATAKYIDIHKSHATLDPLALDLYNLLLQKAPKR